MLHEENDSHGSLGKTLGTERSADLLVEVEQKKSIIRLREQEEAQHELLSQASSFALRPYISYWRVSIFHLNISLSAVTCHIVKENFISIHASIDIDICNVDGSQSII